MCESKSHTIDVDTKSLHSCLDLIHLDDYEVGLQGVTRKGFLVRRQNNSHKGLQLEYWPHD